MNEKYEVLQIDSARDFFDLMRKSHPRWLQDNQRSSRFIFRGQSNSEFKLISSAWRDGKAKSFFDSVKCEIESQYGEITGETTLDEGFRTVLDSHDDNHVDRLTEFTWKIVCELYLINDFIHRSNNVGLKVNKASPFSLMSSRLDFERLQREILFGIKNRDPFTCFEKNKIINAVFRNEEKTDKIDWCYHYTKNFPSFALAQHEGVPTRFLDWTRNPSIALFFAIDSMDKGTEEIAVFALDTDKLNAYGIYVLDEFHHFDNHFLHMQEGVFTYMPYANGWFIKHGYWPSIEDLLSVDGCLIRSPQDPPPKIIKISIKTAEVEELKRLLEAEGVTEEALKPTYGHVADAIRKRLKRNGRLSE